MHLRFFDVVAALAREFRVAFARGYAAADVSAIVISIYHAENVTFLRHIRHHEDLRAQITEYLTNVLSVMTRMKKQHHSPNRPARRVQQLQPENRCMIGPLRIFVPNNSTASLDYLASVKIRNYI